MKLYKTVHGIVAEHENTFYLLRETDWDSFVNDEELYAKMQQSIQRSTPGSKELISHLLAPIGAQQELWACGVTYLRSKIGRQEESRDAGGGDFYARVYEAERPEIFFKSNPHRIAAPGAAVAIRKDSSWDVPEPELTLVVSPSGKIIGYTIGNDMSSRSIEGENPLYLPQAKTYDGCAAIGPCIYVTQHPIPSSTMIHLLINRNGQTVFEGSVGINKMKRSHAELVSFVFRHCSFPHGCLIMTGTGIVPPNEFTLKTGDEIRISIDHIGTLVNAVG